MGKFWHRAREVAAVVASKLGFETASVALWNSANAPFRVEKEEEQQEPVPKVQLLVGEAYIFDAIPRIVRHDAGFDDAWARRNLDIN